MTAQTGAAFAKATSAQFDCEADEPRDHHFKYDLVPATDHARWLFDTVIEEIEAFEMSNGLRKRRRREIARRKMHACVHGILANICLAYLKAERVSAFMRPIAVTRRAEVLNRRSRYRPKAFNGSFVDLLDLLGPKYMGLIEMTLGEYSVFGGKRTTIAPGEKLIGLVCEKVEWEDIGVAHDGEVILLRDKKRSDAKHGALIDYEETEKTRGLRAEIEALNDFMASADIEIVCPDLAERYPAHIRRQRRHFTRGSFECGGRLYGAFWLQMNKQDRRRGIRVQGERIVELDYSGMYPRLLYAHIGVEPPTGDFYDLGRSASFGDSDVEEPDPWPRAGVKALLNAMLWADRPLRGFPGDIRKEKLFPEETDFEQVDRRIRAKHPAFVPHFGSGIGHKLQFFESEIILEVLRRLMALDIVGLQIHDAVLVPESRVEVAKEIMEMVFFERMGAPAVVDVKTHD